jgi:hypothetical protein
VSSSTAGVNQLVIDKVITELNWVRHEHIWGSGGTAESFLTSALDEGEWSASRPGRSTPVPIG